MCFGDPAKSLSIARERMPAEQWARFERDFCDFCAVQGLPDKWAYWPTYDWAKWAFFQGRQSCWRDADREVPVDAAEPIDRKRGPLLRNPVSLKGSPDLPKLVFTIDGNEAPDQEAARQMFLARCASPADVRLADTHYERLALAMMDDEQAVASLERWRGVKGEAE